MTGSPSFQFQEPPTADTTRRGERATTGGADGAGECADRSTCGGGADRSKTDRREMGFYEGVGGAWFLMLGLFVWIPFLGAFCCQAQC